MRERRNQKKETAASVKKKTTKGSNLDGNAEKASPAKSYCWGKKAIAAHKKKNGGREKNVSTKEQFFGGRKALERSNET